jgi:hypothetical protein
MQLVRRHLPSKTVTTIETDSITTSRAVHLNLSGIGCEALSGVFCGDSALEGEASCGNVVLGQAKLLKRCACCNLNLGRNNVDTGDLLGDGVLDLNTRVDLNKVVPFGELAHVVMCVANKV